MRAPEVEHHVPPIASGPVDVGGRQDESGRVEEEDAFTTAAAMLSRGGRRWGDRDGKEEEVEEDNNGVTVAASGGIGRQMADSMSPQQRQRDGGRGGSR
jgi:hypothetical protein